MPAHVTSHEPPHLAPEGRRDEVVAIVAAALARLIQTRGTPVASPFVAPASIPAGNLSESAEPGLELSGETRLSVPAG
jgi:hypothetical protein